MVQGLTTFFFFVLFLICKEQLLQLDIGFDLIKTVFGLDTAKKDICIEDSIVVELVCYFTKARLVIIINFLVKIILFCFF